MMSQDERAVRDVIDGVYAAWAANDADAFVASYAQDAVAVLPGLLLADRAAVHANMAAQFNGQLRGSSCVDEVQTVRFLRPDLAVVHSRSGVVLAGETEPPAQRWVRATWTLSKEDNSWLVRTYQNCAEAVA